MAYYHFGFRLHGLKWRDVEGDPNPIINGYEVRFDEARSKRDGHVVAAIEEELSEEQVSDATRWVPEALRAMFFLSKRRPVQVTRTGFSRRREDGKWEVESGFEHRCRILPCGANDPDVVLSPEAFGQVATHLAKNRDFYEILELLVQAEGHLDRGNDRVAMMHFGLAIDTLANLLGCGQRDQWQQKLARVVLAAGEVLDPADELDILRARHHVCHDADCPPPRHLMETVYLARRVLRLALSSAAGQVAACQPA